MRSPIGKLGALSQKINPLVLSQNHLRHAASDSQRTTPASSRTTSSHTVSSEKRQRVKSNKDGLTLSLENLAHPNGHEHKIDIGDEKADLLGQFLVSGKLIPDKKRPSAEKENQAKANKSKNEVDARLTVKSFSWGPHSLSLSDIVAVSYSDGLRRFTVHAYPPVRKSWVMPSFKKIERKRTDHHFLASSPDDALRWVSAFAELQCFINCLPHPLLSSKPQDTGITEIPPVLPVKCKVSPVMLVILNPRSGRGRSSKVYYGKVEPILKVWIATSNLWIVCLYIS
eukprot:TRINITY_DN20503_c0_g2_i1.p1 TRINITY_DN20503_c0_g2~~TRINITY_DN20503_c0_g2_i1.p1  ORF type:complete len:284 (-),score=29.79 TRINITY_DN20503_c0_g2_i1:2-853(-)